MQVSIRIASVIARLARTLAVRDVTNDPCEADGCDCPNHEEMSSEFTPSLESYYQRAALRERLV
jgi:hypothetical protein